MAAAPICADDDGEKLMTSCSEVITERQLREGLARLVVCVSAAENETKKSLRHKSLFYPKRTAITPELVPPLGLIIQPRMA